MLERGDGAWAGGAAKFCAAKAWATHCSIIASMSGTGGLMVRFVTMLGREVVLETVGGVMMLCCSFSMNRESCSSLIWLAVRSPASSALMESTALLFRMLLATPASWRDAWWF